MLRSLIWTCVIPLAAAGGRVGPDLVAGSFVILFDPIFQGLALSLMMGEVAATLLSRVAVPVLYYLVAPRGP